jgi:hypothetical protein
MNKLLYSILFIFILSISLCSADTQLSKLGNNFSSASGGYSALGHCGDICGWLSGNEVFVGASDSYSPNWGGSVTWNFDLSGINLADIDRAALQVSWPNNLGRGLHSPSNTAQGFASINGNEIARLTTNATNPSLPDNHDYYNPAGMIFYLDFPFSSGFLSSSTAVTLGTTKAIWDVSQVKLFLYASNKTVRIVNGKMLFKGSEFMMKGIDYAPWIKDAWAFPNENDDVTSKMTNSGKATVKDYNSNGKIEMGEVVQYDLETMKAVGVNTIRLYSSGGWHDKNLNGAVDSGETLQGDLPDWAIDKILNFANSNGMKVIIGYWVGEENSDGVANFNDLPVAKQAFGRVVNKYKGNDAVIAWGIGNEVQGGFNMIGFNWSVDINTYLNQLNDYVRTLDANHPIIYAKYVGENANFNNNNAEVISINAFDNSAQALIDAGEFSIAAPQGKAYMLGEYGHTIGDADAQWSLAKDYAGGCFLEYNDIWWKVDTAFGIVNQYREKRSTRYNKLLYLYTGSTVECYSDSECGTEGFIGNTSCNLQDNKQVLQDYETYTCNNPGTSLSTCSRTISEEVNSTCEGTDICDPFLGFCVPLLCAGAGPGCGDGEWGDFYEPFDSITSINANGGLVMNGAADIVAGEFGNYLNLTSGAYLNYPAMGNWPAPNTNMTIEFWVKPENRSSYGLFDFGGLNGMNPNALGIFFNSNSLWSEIRNNSTAMYQASTGGIIPGQWNQVALRLRYYSNYSSNCLFMDLYANEYARYYKYACFFYPNFTSTMLIGNSPFYGPSYSYFDEFRIYDYEKSDVEIRNDYFAMLNTTGQNVPVINCSSDAECGTSGYEGDAFCNSNNTGVMKKYVTHSCVHAGTSSSYCKKTETNASLQACSAMCSNGACVNFTCSANSNCGTSGFTGTAYCSGRDVWSNYTTFSCKNPGTALSYCSNSTALKLKKSCSYMCSSGACLSAPKFTNLYQPFNNLSSITQRAGIAQNGNIGFMGTKCGNALNLTNGTYISYPLAGNFPSSGVWSVEFWMKPGNRSSYGLFGIDILQGRPNSWGIFSNYNRTYLEMWNNTGRGFQIYSKPLKANKWSHVAVTFANTSRIGCYTAALYLNSTKQSSQVFCGLSVNMTKDMRFGWSGFYGPSYSNMDELRVVNRALTATEISTDFKRMKNCTAGY